MLLTPKALNRRLVLAGLLTRFHFANLPTPGQVEAVAMQSKMLQETHSCGHSPCFSQDSLFVFFGSLPKKNQLQCKGMQI